MATPGRPVAWAKPSAMWPAPCSWRTRMWRIGVSMHRVVHREDGAAGKAEHHLRPLHLEGTDECLSSVHVHLSVLRRGGVRGSVRAKTRTTPPGGEVEGAHADSDLPDGVRSGREYEEGGRRTSTGSLAPVAPASNPRSGTTSAARCGRPWGPHPDPDHGPPGQGYSPPDRMGDRAHRVVHRDGGADHRTRDEDERLRTRRSASTARTWPWPCPTRHPGGRTQPGDPERAAAHHVGVDRRDGAGGRDPPSWTSRSSPSAAHRQATCSPTTSASAACRRAT
jgi:hypothetical protein